MIGIKRKDVTVPLSLRHFLSPCWMLYHAARQWRQRQRAMQQLRALDDRMLRDIGIARSEIMAAVCGVHTQAKGQALKRQPFQTQRSQSSNKNPLSP